MQSYLIDGNNLIWKIPKLKRLQQNDVTKNAAREKLIFILQRFFADKKINVTVFFDGAPHAALGGAIKIKYSYERKADELIREAIDSLKTKHNAAVISSDHWIADYAKVNGCKVIRSEEFAKTIEKEPRGKSKEEIIKNLQNENWEDVFGIE